jgi:polyisoprenyl-phosphate glycosyltransferase
MPYENCASPSALGPPPLPPAMPASAASCAKPHAPVTRYSLVIPVYKNERSIDRLIETLRDLNGRLDGLLEVVFVVDGSPDRSYEILREKLCNSSFAAELVSLSRNFGSFSAVRMGLSLARGPYFAVMAADLQEPPELVYEFFRSLGAEPIDIVLGVRTDRDDPLFSKTSANLFWSIYRRVVQRDMPPGGVDAFACTRQVRDALMSLNESNSSLVGQVLWLGFRRKQVPYRRLPRKEGKSGWTFRRKLRYMFDSIFAFTDLPLTLLLAVGTLGVLFSTLIGTLVFVAWCLGAIVVPGYTPMILAILLSMFCQLLGLGVIGAYVWRGYENTKGRPAFIPMLHDSFPRDPDAASAKMGLSPSTPDHTEDANS